MSNGVPDAARPHSAGQILPSSPQPSPSPVQRPRGRFTGLSDDSTGFRRLCRHFLRNLKWIRPISGAKNWRHSLPSTARVRPASAPFPYSASLRTPTGATKNDLTRGSSYIARPLPLPRLPCTPSMPCSLPSDGAITPPAGKPPGPGPSGGGMKNIPVSPLTRLTFVFHQG